MEAYFVKGVCFLGGGHRCLWLGTRPVIEHMIPLESFNDADHRVVESATNNPQEPA
jgi:hypothetical protein